MGACREDRKPEDEIITGISEGGPEDVPNEGEHEEAHNVGRWHRRSEHVIWG